MGLVFKILLKNEALTILNQDLQTGFYFDLNWKIKKVKKDSFANLA